MDGKLQPLIEALTTHYQAEKLKQEATTRGLRAFKTERLMWGLS